MFDINNFPLLVAKGSESRYICIPVKSKFVVAVKTWFLFLKHIPLDNYCGCTLPNAETQHDNDPWNNCASSFGSGKLYLSFEIVQNDTYCIVFVKMLNIC